jgi:hypothetical protein
MDLTTATPVEIDTALAEIYGRLYAQQDKTAQLLGWIRDMKDGLAKQRAGDRRYSSYNPKRLGDLEEKYADSQDEALRILAETYPYESEYRRRPWTRFFLVNNNGGHIHSSMDCSTCNNGKSPTRFGWLPNLSGQSEPEAVAAHGAILCTVCYPSAPSEWTDRRDDSVCPGSGKYFNSSLPHRGPHFYSGNWATCETCGTTQTMVKSGKIRKHKKA